MSDEERQKGAMSGKVAVVVGGASGVGRATAQAFAHQGARVVIADFDAERLDRTLEEILHIAGTDAALALPTDVRSDSSVKSLAADAVKAMGSVDVLVNMAGVFLQGPVDQLKAGDWRWMLDTNLLGTVRTTLAFLPHMVGRGSGHIVNAVSKGASPTTVAYDAGSAAVAAFTDAVAEKVKDRGVHVSVYPLGPHGPRLGQNTRSRGMGRLLRRKDDLEEPLQPDGHVIDDLLEIVHR